MPEQLVRVIDWVRGTFAGRCVGRFVEIQGLDRSVVLASQAFTALLPLLIVVVSLLPADKASVVADQIIDRFDLTGDVAATVAEVFTLPTGEATGLGVFSVLLVVVAAMSFTRRLQRMYEACWELPPLGARGSLSAALGLLVLVSEIVVLGALRSLLERLPFSNAFVLPVVVVATVALWTAIPYLLLGRRIAWRRLLPGAVVTAAAAVVLTQVGQFYIPGALERYSERYGLLGVSLALIGWLLTLMVTIVACTVIGVEIDRSEHPWAQRIRHWERWHELSPEARPPGPAHAQHPVPEAPPPTPPAAQAPPAPSPGSPTG